jgi:hypothetical protein
VPALEFYALGADRPAVLDLVFATERFRVFEAYSRPGTSVREFSSPAEALDAADPPHGPALMLWAADSGPDPYLGRIGLDPEAWDGGTFRFECNGWGMIQLVFGGVLDGELHPTRISHNTPRRAAAWAGDLPELGDPAAWSWPVVSRAAGRLIREVRALATSPGRPVVLPDAARTVERDGLTVS